MLVTPDFVLLANPRTGSTFARKAVLAAYAQRADAFRTCQDLVLPIQRGRGVEGFDHHGTVAQIPITWAERLLVTTVRHPLSLSASGYKLQLWRRRWPVGVDIGTYPSFPNLSFGDYLRLQEDAMAFRWDLAFPEFGIGPLSAHFIQMFALAPEHAFARLRQRADVSELITLLPPLTLIIQERLRLDLSALLARFGLPESAVHDIAPSNMSRSGHDALDRDQTAPLAAYVYEREHLLIELLRRFGVRYPSADVAD